MNKLFTGLFAMLALFHGIHPQESFSQDVWVKTGGPLGGLGYDVRIDFTDKEIMYVTDNWSGLNKSTNAGVNWFNSNAGIDVFAGPTGDAVPIFSLTIDPNNTNRLWAGTFGDGTDFGVFRSDDQGETWTRKTNGMSLGDDHGLVFRGFTIQEGNSDIVYAQAELHTGQVGWHFDRVKGRVYKSTDGGENWVRIWEGDNLARYLIIDPTDSEVLYLSTGIFDREAYDSDCENGILGGVGVLKSYDGGDTWTQINNGLDDTYVGSLRMHPTNPQILFAATAGVDACLRDAGGNSGLYRTTNGGASWALVIAGNKTTVNFSPSNPDIIYAAFEDAFYRSEDGGSTWKDFSGPSGRSYGPPGIIAGIPIDVIVDPEDPYKLYVNNYAGGVFRSTDGAETWESWSEGYTGAEILKVHVMTGNPSTVYALTKSGPFVSYNAGTEWIGIANGDASSGSLASGAYSMAVHPSDQNIILMTSSFHGVIYRSIDGGADFDWVFQHPGSSIPDTPELGFRAIEFSKSHPNMILAGISTNMADIPLDGTVICKSTDTGATWNEKPSVMDGKNVTAITIHPSDPNIAYAGTQGDGIFKTMDGADNWTYLSSFGDHDIRALVIDTSNPQVIYAGEENGGVWKSADGGQTWVGPNNTGFSSGNPSIWSLVIDPTDPSVIYAADWTSGVYQSIDGGESWSPFPDDEMSGLSTRSIKHLCISSEGTVIYAASHGEGVFSHGEIPTGIGDDGSSSPEIPIAFSITQNYPNPFNPSTTVRYEIPVGYERGIHVRLEVFNVRGQRVTTLVDAAKVSGSYEVHWNSRDEGGKQVGSGIYIYRLEVGPYTLNRKMVISR